MTTVKLWPRRGYEGEVQLPAEVDAKEIVSALEGFGFLHVQASWDEGAALWRVRAVWGGRAVEVEPPPVLLNLRQFKAEAKGPAQEKPTRQEKVSKAKPRGLARRPRSQGLSAPGDWSPTVSHQQARAWLLQAWAQVFPNVEPTLSALQAVQAVSLHETGYGRGWKDAMRYSYNQGAVQCGKVQDKDGNCPAGCAPYGDSRPTPQGQVAYAACFKVYPNDVAGWADLLRVMGKANVRAVWNDGDLDAVALGMRKNYYFGGICTNKKPSPLPPCKVFDDKMAAAQYANALEIAVNKMAAALKERVAIRRSGKLGEVPSTDAQGNPVYKTRVPLRGRVHLTTAAMMATVAGAIFAATGERPW